MTRQEWTRAEPILTSALFLSPQEQRAAIESANIGEALRRELLDLLRRTAPVVPRPSLSHAGSGTPGLSDGSLGPEPGRPAAPLLQAGESLADGRFAVVRQLGRGGMGEVYLAHDRTLGNLVALKVLFEPALREAQHARLCAGHPHVVTVYDAFPSALADRTRTVLVMEYVAGQPASRLVDDGPQDLRSAVRWARHAAAAMAHAHDHGVLHCDLKPANILITADAGAKVVDFGIGRATYERSSTSEPLRGTPEYMAPEQLLEGQFTEAGDIYSLGVTLFELVTGRVPFEGTATEVMLQIAGAEPPLASSLRDSVPATLDDLLARALAKDPRHRYRTARALDRALEALEHELTTQTSPVPSPLIAPIPPPPGPTPWTYIGRGVQVVLLLTILGFVSSTALDAGLGRTGAFRTESPLWWPVWGAMSLTAPAAVTAGSAIVLALLSPLLRQLARVTAIGRQLQSVGHRLGAVPTSHLAHALLVLHVAAVGMLLVSYAPLLGAIAGFSAADASADIDLLGPQHYRLQNSYRQSMTALLAVFGFGWYLLMRRIRLLGERDGRPVLWAAAFITGASLLLNVMPHRLFYANDAEQVLLGSQHCSLVAERGSDVLLFCPNGPNRNQRVPVNHPDLSRPGLFREIFTPLNPDEALPIVHRP